MSDVRSLRGAECGSDHFLTLVKIKQRLQTSKRVKYKAQPKVCYEKLKQMELLENLNMNLNNRFESLEEMEDDENTMDASKNIEEQWATFRNIIKEATTKVLKTSTSTPPQKKHWFDSDCAELTEKRKKAKHQWLNCNNTQKDEYREAYNKVNRDVVKLVRKKKREEVNKSLEKAENDRTKNNSRDFYRVVRHFKNGYKPRTSGIKDKDGNTTNETAKVLETWKEYFKNLLNGELQIPNYTNSISTNQTPSIYGPDNQVEEPTLGEVQEVINNMKNGKSPGEDGIPIEILKYGGDALQKYVFKLIMSIWRSETIPNEWKEAVVVPLHKKGDKLTCNNYRGISLLNTTYKVLSKIVLNRLKYFEKDIIDEHQAGFVKGRSTID